MRALPAFWYTVAANLAALWLAVVLYAVVREDVVVGLPVCTVAVSGTAGLVGLARRRTRRLGAGCAAGAVASAALFAVVLVIFFVTYFVLGGHELS